MDALGAQVPAAVLSLEASLSTSKLWSYAGWWEKGVAWSSEYNNDGLHLMNTYYILGLIEPAHLTLAQSPTRSSLPMSFTDEETSHSGVKWQLVGEI